MICDRGSKMHVLTCSKSRIGRFSGSWNSISELRVELLVDAAELKCSWTELSWPIVLAWHSHDISTLSQPRV